MIFSSLLFLFYFLAPVLCIYCLVGQRWKNLVLLIASLFFYAWGEPRYIFLMLFSIAFNYLSGFVIGTHKSKIALTINCVVNLSLLAVFKYCDFFIATINGLVRTHIPFLELALPVGISFYTFQALSYCIDLYRGKCEIQRDFVSFGLYISLFPQLIAGPIVRYDNIASQLPHHPQTIKLFSEGVQRFSAGLAKKVLIANNVGQLWELCVATEGRSMLCAWLGILAYTLQIYYDFSGYSDMAIGLGKMFGFRFCENFNYPYISKSITEFWHRWHISLSSWFKEYVYIPLGGSHIYAEDYKTTTRLGKITLTPERKATLRTFFNILIVWLLTGLWHGASFNFVAWGLYYGIILILEKRIWKKHIEKFPGFVQVMYTMFIVIIGWVFFASPDFITAFKYIGSMFNIFALGITDEVFLFRLLSYWLVMILGIAGATPIVKRYFKNITSGKLYWIRPVLSVIALLVCMVYIVDDTYNPFLYFRF